MRIECWLVTACCTLDDLPVAALDSEGEAHDECTRLRSLTDDELDVLLERLTTHYGLPDSSEFIRFVVRHVPNQLSAKPAGE